MAEFVKKCFTGNHKSHPKMVMFILETIVPWVYIEGVSAACANVNALHVTAWNLVSSLDDFGSYLHALEYTTGLEVWVGAALSINVRRN